MKISPALTFALATVCLGLAPLAQAQVAVKVEVIAASLKLENGKPPKLTGMKNPREMMNKINRKTLEKTQLRLTYGQPSSLKLPNGTELKLTAISFDAASGMIKMRAQTIVEHYGLDTEYSIKNGGVTFVNAGVYQKTAMLMVSLSPSLR